MKKDFLCVLVSFSARSRSYRIFRQNILHRDQNPLDTKNPYSYSQKEIAKK